jgi:hypothetical protein
LIHPTYPKRLLFGIALLSKMLRLHRLSLRICSVATSKPKEANCKTQSRPLVDRSNPRCK